MGSPTVKFGKEFPLQGSKIKQIVIKNQFEKLQDFFRHVGGK